MSEVGSETEIEKCFFFTWDLPTDGGRSRKVLLKK